MEGRRDWLVEMLLNDWAADGLEVSQLVRFLGATIHGSLSLRECLHRLGYYGWPFSICR